MTEKGSVSMVGEEPVLSRYCLMKAEVSWMSTVRGNLSYEERILRRVRSILNKLTVEKYTLLKTQLIDSGITTKTTPKINKNSTFSKSSSKDIPSKI
ncbi:hypothetical protein MKW94_026836 [Papaver nudicaule]|uniref:Uncharacterized protein n=1 Tax=Papaver nudicaule TaxID=74823 RepID=A0AA41SC17_PAPNU|nr:hypothetical protein [Papaver nudicaule]